ncbi:cell surface protein SprA, partial [Candidatus Atribacteria bacterium 4572_76]
SAMTVDLQKYKTYQRIDFSNTVKRNSASVFPRIGDNYYTKLKRDSVYFTLSGISSRYKDGAEIDSSMQYVVIYEKLFEEDYKQTVIMKLADYKEQRLKYENKNLWYQQVATVSDKESSTSSNGEIQINIPVKIKSRTFNRIFGGNRIGLRVRGDLSFSLIGSKSATSGYSLSGDESGSFDFKMDQTQNISIRGKVGSKVDVDINQNTESMDFENTLKITYTGDSDEIVQKLEAGNIGLSLPGTKYVTFSGKNTGLFGIKTDLKIGNLTSTIIASLEKGKKKKLELTGGVRTQTKIIEADKYQKLKYFFLDDSYRENYSSPNNYEKRLSHTVMDVSQTPVKSNSFNLYITSRANGSDREKANIYVDCQNRDQLEIDGIQNLYKENNWVRWIDPDDYVINDGLGYIYLKSVNLQAGEVLAARYNKYDVETGNEIEIGERDENGLLHLQIIAENGQNYDDPWSDNEWKNVYYLGGSDVRKDGFKLTIFKGDDSETKTPKKKTYLEWYQVAQENEQDVDLGFLNSANGEFFFPELTPFWPDLNLNSNLDSIHLYDQDSAIVAQFVDSLIYKEDDKRSEFKLQVEFASKSSTFDLGFNVIEDSEVVRMGATQLVRDIDYIIDYNTGQLSIINGDAMTGDLEILYESASIFQLDQKLLLGNRWQYQFTKDAWLGATILYLSESTKEDRIHVGYEPKKNFVWDVNGKASFEVPFFTRIVDNIPFINTDAKSKISLEGEIAQIIPNPNPLGKAFVDDFEGSRRQRSLGMIYYGWHPASLPDDYETEGSYSYKPEVISDNIDPKILPYFLKSHACEGRLNFFWYNPQSDEQREKREIYREGMEGDEGTQKINTLNFEFDPAGESPALAEQVNIGDRWNGVMRYIPTMYQDFSEIKYIEFLVGTDQKITLNFDIGELSEDAIPNGFIDTEDINGDGKLNDLDGEDIGLDGMGKRDNNDFYTIAADPDSAREARFYEFRSYDDHPMNGDRPKPDSDIQYEEYNKTQGNGRLDTEDLDLGGNLDLTVKGYRYSLELNNNISDLNEGDGYLVSKDTYEGQFALYRIPLDDIRRKIIGSDEPDMEKIKYVKLWFNGASSKTKVEFVSLDFVGNEWKAEGDNKGKIDAATINSIDNNNYTPPFKVEEDSDGNEVKEQSICLKLNLDQDYGVNDKEAFVVKELYKGENYIEYQKIKMYVHGGDGLIPWPEERDIYFVYRFGKDSVNYYEYRSKLKNGWAGNELDVQLDSLTYLKTKRAEKGITNVDSLFMVPYNNMEMSRLIGIYGNPSLRDIRYLAAGVVDYGTEALETELWLDELRLTGIRKEKGMAMRGQINFQFADFATLDAEIERKDAEFHNVHQRMGSGTNELNFNLNSKLELGMFFPKSYGISLPLRYTHINNYSYSKYEGSTDILVAENDIPDSVKIETKSHRARISVKKNSKSKNPFVKHTLDKLSFGADAFFSEEKNSTYIKKETETYSYNASYNLSFPKEWVTFSPFKWTENIWGLKKIKNEKISLIPSSYSTSIATSQSLTESRSRKDAFRTNNIFTVTRTLSTSFNPISILKTNYSLNLNSDMYKKKISIVDDETGNSTRGVAVDYHKYDYKSFLEGKFGELSSWSSNYILQLEFYFG